MCQPSGCDSCPRGQHRAHINGIFFAADQRRCFFVFFLAASKNLTKSRPKLPRTGHGIVHIAAADIGPRETPPLRSLARERRRSGRPAASGGGGCLARWPDRGNPARNNARAVSHPRSIAALFGGLPAWAIVAALRWFRGDGLRRRVLRSAPMIARRRGRAAPARGRHPPRGAFGAANLRGVSSSVSVRTIDGWRAPRCLGGSWGQLPPDPH